MIGVDATGMDAGEASKVAVASDIQTPKTIHSFCTSESTKTQPETKQNTNDNIDEISSRMSSLSISDNSNQTQGKVDYTSVKKKLEPQTLLDMTLHKGKFINYKLPGGNCVPDNVSMIKKRRGGRGGG